MTCTCTNPNHNHGACTPNVDAVRYCNTCYDAGLRVLMERHGRAYVCPVAATEARGVSQERRESIKATAAAIDATVGF